MIVFWTSKANEDDSLTSWHHYKLPLNEDSIEIDGLDRSIEYVLKIQLLLLSGVKKYMTYKVPGMLSVCLIQYI